MKPALWLLLGLVIGGSASWYVRGLTDQVRASTAFSFNDQLADRQTPYLSAMGSWRGETNKINTVQITCDASEGRCNMHQADVMSRTGHQPWISLNSTTFSIKRLDAAGVVAEPSLPNICVRQTLTLDRVAKAVTLVRVKTSRLDACSMVQDEPVTLLLGSPL
jgi:hypothetical protein